MTYSGIQGRKEDRIEEWQEAFFSLTDEKFSSLMRLYLGEIKTPYNKQRLISQLASFIRNSGNLRSIIGMLDAFDLNVLTAVRLLPAPTCPRLTEFFGGQYSAEEIYSEATNLSDRLILFTAGGKNPGGGTLRINPLLEDELAPLLSTARILPPARADEMSYSDTVPLSPDLIAAFMSFVRTKGCSSKSDGTIKKNDMNRISAIFAGRERQIQLLFSAFSALGILLESEKRTAVDQDKLRLFSEMETPQQYAFICAASCGRESRDGLRKSAQLLLDCVSSVPPQGSTRRVITRMAYLAGARTDGGFSRSRFSRMIEAARCGGQAQADTDAGKIADRLIDSAVEFGILERSGFDADGNEILVRGSCMDAKSSTGEPQKVLNIESTFSVTFLPGLDLAGLLPLTSFLSVTKSGTVTEYEITRQSVSAAFDESATPQQILEELQSHTPYPLPQNLRLSVEEWFASYSAATIYHGYVLKTSGTNTAIAENNPKISRFIKEKLADGIYFLNIPADMAAETFIRSSGLEFMGKTREASEQRTAADFPLLREPQKIVEFEDEEIPEEQNFAAQTICGLRQELDKMDIPPQHREWLAAKITKRLIISPEQLRNASFRAEILEADGMDFAGKIHLIEAAIKAGDMLSVRLPSMSGGGEFNTFLGKPLQLIKQQGEALLSISAEPEHITQNISVSRISYLKRLH